MDGAQNIPNHAYVEQAVFHPHGVRVGSCELSEELKEKIFQIIKKERKDLGEGPFIIEDCSFVVWTSSALGMPEEGKYYCCVMVPGYCVSIQSKDQRVTLHIDENGNHFAIRDGS